LPPGFRCSRSRTAKGQWGDSMKVLVLNGCSDEKSATQDLLKGICDGIPAPHEIAWINLHGLAIQSCQKCHKCFPCGECVLPEDDAHAVARSMFSADALIIGLQASPQDIHIAVERLFERCMSAMAFKTPQGDFRPWRQGRFAILACHEACCVAVNESKSPQADSSSVAKALEIGGFNLIKVTTQAKTGQARDDFFPVEKARSLGCSLSCIMIPR